MMSDFKSSMQKEFDMTDLGKMRFFLGIEVLQGSEGIYICQRKYAMEVLRRFGVEDNNSVCLLCMGTRCAKTKEGSR